MWPCMPHKNKERYLLSYSWTFGDKLEGTLHTTEFYPHPHPQTPFDHLELLTFYEQDVNITSVTVYNPREKRDVFSDFLDKIGGKVRASEMAPLP